MLPSLQAREVAWEHYRHARHVQGMSNSAILLSIGLKPDKVPTSVEVMVALEQAWIAMQLGVKSK